MIIIFHCLCNLILRIVKNKRYLNFSEGVVIPLQSNIKLECILGPEDLGSIRAPMHCQRHRAVFQNLLDERWRKQIKTLVDFGSSEVDLIRFLECLSSLNEIVFVNTYDHITGACYKSPTTSPHLEKENSINVTLLAGNVANLDCRLFNTDAVTAIELIHHLYPDVLEAFLHNVFNYMQPKIIVVTTANASCNGMLSGDHKFLWTREQFQDWATNITVRFPDYSVSYSSIGESSKDTEHLAQCSQMAVFVRKDLLDGAYKLTMDFPHCVCGSHSQYKGLPTESKSCKCFCALCYPNALYGICTYYSYTNQIVRKESEDDQRKQSWSLGNGYKLIKSVKYPICEDGHVEEQKIVDKFQYKIHCLGQQWGMFYAKAKSRYEIPLMELNAESAVCITVPELHKLLTRHGFRIEECLTDGRDLPEPCVIHHPEDRVGMSSPSVPSGVSSPSEPSDWDERCDKGQSGETGEAHQSTKAIIKCTEMTTRDSHLDPSTDIEEEKKQHDALFDSGYQKSLSLLDDSPQTPLEDLEETDLFEETTSTPSSSSDDNKVHLRRAIAVEKAALPPIAPDVNKVKIDPSSAENDRYRNLPAGRPFLAHPPPPQPQEVYKKSFLKDIEPLAGPSSASRKRKKVKKGVQSDSEEDSPLSEIKSIASSILENTLNEIEQKEKDVIVAPGVEVVAAVEVAALVEVAQERVVENGDLANNNRDIEGNNYIAQDEGVVVDNVGNDIANDNLEVVGGAVVVAEEVANADNNNDGAGVAAVAPPRRPAEEDVAQPESAVAQASREALFDENSEQDLLEDFEVLRAPVREDAAEEHVGIRLVGIRLASTPEDFDPDQATTDGFPNWLLQILGAQAILEEVTPTGSQEGSHFYCQGDGLGVHPSVIAVDVDEEDETTESSNNTADYGEAEQGSSQDMPSLPEDPQNIQGNEAATENDDQTLLTVSERNLPESQDPGSDLGANQND